MFAARFDPGALLANRKRRLSKESGSESESESEHEQVAAITEEEDKNEEESESSSEEESESEHEAENENSSDEDEDMEKNEQKNDESEDIEMNEDNNEQIAEYNDKHSSIFSRFKSVAKNDTDDSEDSEKEEEEEEEILNQLVPLPQPELPRDRRLSRNIANNLDWLTTPTYVKTDVIRPFEEFNLNPSLLNNLSKDGFKTAFSVQISVMNMLLQDIERNKLNPDDGGDVLVNASTGSGKTLAYCIPIIQALSERIVPRVRAIILVPTKPLIQQVRNTLVSLARGSNLNIVSLRNESSIRDEHEKLIKNVPDIIISTPGRLVEHLGMNSIDITSLRYLIIDEADRLLNQSFQNWCNILMKEIEKTELSQARNSSNFWRIRIQKLVFSATLTTDAGKLSLLKFNKPRLLIVNNEESLVNELFTLPKELKEYQLNVGTAKASLKPLLLANMLIQKSLLSNVLIFTKSNESTLRLSRLLQILVVKLNVRVTIDHINSTVSALNRKKILREFSTGEINVLIATDLIARGIDILTITDVVNYDLPISSREYVHRVGRTARAGNSGNAWNLVIGGGERKWFNRMAREISRNGNEIEMLDPMDINGRDEESYRDALADLEKEVFKK